MENKKPHQHIDSSGAFDCPVWPECNMPDAGQQFDLMNDALMSLVSWDGGNAAALIDKAFKAINGNGASSRWVKVKF